MCVSIALHNQRLNNPNSKPNPKPNPKPSKIKFI